MEVATKCICLILLAKGEIAFFAGCLCTDLVCSDYDHIRPLSYARADGFLVCFSISNRSSLQNVADKW